MDDLVLELSDLLRARGERLVLAESCTGGLLAAAMTDLAGSSSVFERGFVTYSNEAKVEALGVKEAVIEEFGAVSEETAEAMAVGALKRSHADIALAITGIAGPDGGTKDKPVGLVYLGYADKTGKNYAKKYLFEGNRGQIREKTVEQALVTLIRKIKGVKS